MKCPVCKKNEHVDINLHADGFSENIMECGVCGTLWSINYEGAEVVITSQERSFIGEGSEFYYSFAA